MHRPRDKKGPATNSNKLLGFATVCAPHRVFTKFLITKVFDDFLIK
jgi:hypothetical protein